ncbi:hypothetical protein L3Y34_000209 [Caenorhabditis briggsae]|uniref:HTH CENPB-type domain-containing protein n=2 Tax=Caenorhabditis briggsae TaxID=6238 RepID=A0AAE9IMW2_CAEBR|nr:hypothetical protein L3Y34_000209 [Caenorhabditis briggsae]
MSSEPRRSTRLVTATSAAVFDNTPFQVAPKKRRAPSSSSSHTPQPSPSIHRNVQNGGNSNSPIQKFENPGDLGQKKEPAAYIPDPESEALHQQMAHLKTHGMSNITLKDFIGKNSKNFKTRQSIVTDRAAQLVHITLRENVVPEGAVFFGLPTIKKDKKKSLASGEAPEFTWQTEGGSKAVSTTVVPPQQTISDVLSKIRTSSDSPMPSKKPCPAEVGLENLVSRANLSKSPESSILEPRAYPGNHLPWPLFWKQVPPYEIGEEVFYCHVENCTYSPMTEIIKAGIFLVPLDESVDFEYNGKVVQLTLNEIFEANGINMIGSPQHYRMLQGVFQKAGIYIKGDYAKRLHQMQMGKGEDGQAAPKLYLPPIQLTANKLPLICIKPDVYMSYLGRRIHGAVIVDTSGDKDPLPGQTFLTTIYSEPLSLHRRCQILIAFDVGKSIPEISALIGCSERSIKETLCTRILIDRHLVDQYLEELEAEEESKNPEMMRQQQPKNKIRRTHYVDLNKLVWKYFKDCQASGQMINGKMIKDQAMRYARDMGLESFRGSEGWLDAFKRRHRIDLKAMTGYPVCYENDMFDEVEKECRDLDMESHLNNLPGSSYISNGNSAPDEFAASFFNSFSGFSQPMLNQVVNSHQQTQEPNLQTMINHMMTNTSMVPPTMVPQPSLIPPSTSNSSQAPETANNVMRSFQIKQNDKEIESLLTKLRQYILDHDQESINLLVPLQERLSRVVQKNGQNGTSSSSSSNASSTNSSL